MSRSEHAAEKDAATLAEVAALADRWAAVLDECKTSDPRWILDPGVMALNTCLTELRRVTTQEADDE